MAANKTTFVLVHGAWHGGWSYAPVAERLRARGHAVYTPSLTGCGERSHLIGGAINLSLHIQDVLNVFRYERIERAVLAGHSYGGMVVTGVADRIADKIPALVYLDAFVPEDGQSIWDVNIPANTARYLAAAGDTGGFSVPAPPASFWGLNKNDWPLYEALCGPHPVACFTERIKLTGAHKAIRKRIYVHATEIGRPCAFLQFYDRYKNDPGWIAHALACGHDVTLDMPDKTTEILLSAAED
jgi:pimeloyl-ACP methyl ester carboxylesterase